MPIPPTHLKRYIYHFTHLYNLEGVLKHGFLSYNEQIRAKVKHRSIALADIQKRRARMKVPCGPRGVVHDYVPLYFSKLSPMLLAVVNSKNVDQEFLLHFAYPIDILGRDDVVFTDAAANTLTPPSFYEDPAQLDKLDWSAIDRTKWGSEGDQKHARMAEALVHEKLDPTQAAYILVWNESVKRNVLAIFKKAGVAPPRIEFDGHDGYHSFSQFRAGLPKDMLRTSVSVGPIRTKTRFLSVLKEIEKQSPNSSPPQFGSLSALLTALQGGGLGVLPETSELIDLESENEVHKEDVGAHTLTVVKKLRLSDEFRALKHSARTVVELAAYLHDIGKGPKSRWADCGGKQQVDHSHPIRSAEMLSRIFSESVAKPDESTTRTLCMLVCYHDLIGDIVGKGRSREQLIGVVRSEEELDMLIALGKADMSSVAMGWGIDAREKVPSLREWAIEQIGEATDDDDDDDDDDDEDE